MVRPGDNQNGGLWAVRFNNPAMNLKRTDR